MKLRVLMHLNLAAMALPLTSPPRRPRDFGAYPTASADESGPLTCFPKLAKFLRLPTAVGFLSNEIHLQHRGRVNVRYWHKADMLNALTNVRCRG